MNIRVGIPTKAQILSGGFDVLVTKSATWRKSQLGDYAGRSGVYVLHSNGKILYVGKTTKGEWGNFGERLRRHLQEKASNNSPLFQLLLKQKTTIKAYLLDLEDVEMMVDQGPIPITADRKALIMEQVLIGVFEPEGNRT